MSTTQERVTRDRRFRRDDPCPICHGYPSLPQGNGERCAGFYSPDGQYAHCTREEYAGTIEPTRATPPTYGHWLGGPCRCGKTHDGVPASEQGSKKRQRERHNVVRTPFYAVDASGTTLGVHMREDFTDQDGKPGKAMWWERHAGRSSQDMPLWNTPAAHVAASDVRLWLTEGEKKAQRLQNELRAGGRPDIVVATMTGADGTPCDDALRIQIGHTVILWPDNDDKGKKHQREIAQHLFALGADRGQLYWVAWDDAPAKADAWDYFSQGGGVKRLELMVKPYSAKAGADDQDVAKAGADTPHAPVHLNMPALFPVEVLPRPLRDLVEQGAKAIYCPPEFIAVPALAMLGSAIGMSHCIEIKRGFRQFPSLRTAIVARAGDKKSPPYALASAPLHERQQELHQKFQVELAAYQAAQQSDDASAVEPRMGEIYVTDATIEALGDALEVTPRGLIFLSEELGGWALSMNQYKGGKGADRKAWLSIHDCAPTKINRRSRRHPQYLHAPFVAVTGTIQPDVLGELSDERGREDGFIHRILFSYPEPMEQVWTEDETPSATEAAYRDLFGKLWDLQPDKNEAGDAQPQVLRFTEAGKCTFVAWIDDHFAEMNAPGFPDNLRGPWAKMNGYAARLALILHLCRRVSGETASYDVDEESMAAAADLIDYFKSHARKVYAHLCASPEDKRALAAVAWIKRQPGQKATARDIVTAGLGGVTNSEQAQQLLADLQERGYGKAEWVKSKRGRPSFIFTLTLPNPASSSNPPGQEGRAA